MPTKYFVYDDNMDEIVDGLTGDTIVELKNNFQEMVEDGDIDLDSGANEYYILGVVGTLTAIPTVRVSAELVTELKKGK